MGQVKKTVVIRKGVGAEASAAPSGKMSGHDISHELYMMMVELDSVSDFDDEAIFEWKERFHELLSKESDKMYAYRKVISIAKSREKLFKEEAERYTKRSKAQKNVATGIKELANVMSARHFEMTGEKSISLHDGTFARHVLKDAYEFHLAGQPGVPITAYDVPSAFLRDPEISMSSLRTAAARGDEIEGVTYRSFKKGHVRWS